MNGPALHTYFSPDDPAVRLVRDLLQAARAVLVTTHRHPDGDAVGALLATTRALRARGIDATAHTPDPPPAFLRFLPGFGDITHDAGSLPRIDLVLALDHSELRRTGLETDLLAAQRPVVAVDHHATADRRASVALVRPEAAATCELLAHLFPLIGLSTDAGTATCLLTGIVTDTGAFQHPNTTAAVLQAASNLLLRGADLPAIMTGVYGSKPIAALRVMGRVLTRLHASPQTGAVVSFVTAEDLRECGAREEDLTGVVNLLNTIPEASFSLLLTEYQQGKVKGSLRAQPEKAVDVSQIARRLGGGGHTLASGFEVAGRLVRDASGWRIE